jgi:hypothetical protein
MVENGKSNKIRLRVRRVVDVPLHEVSGICLRRPSLRGWENQAIFATRSPTAIRDNRPFWLASTGIQATFRSSQVQCYPS